ncbi:MAG: hypothetical protein KDC34_18905 [Saprospiraceae bacterium]|nr:hypothetical protein [Saprospiraceae bacterium]
MASFRLCPGDPLVNALQKAFKANIVRIPGKKIQPLAVIGRRGSQLKYLGSLHDLLVDSPDLGLTPSVEPMAQVSGNHSRSVDFNFGVSVLEGFLQGFGLSTPGVKEAFKGTKDISFGFPEMQEHYVEALPMGRAIGGKILDKTNPVLAPYYTDPEAQLLVVDSIIAGKNFTVKIEKTVDSETDVSLGSIGQALQIDDTKIKVETKSGNEIKFEGEDYLTFAFTCLRMKIDADSNTIISVDASNDKLVLEKSAPERIVVEDEPAMIEVDF